jgi:lipid II isoglutaminyl synthase (glutamine-hydrolysing)
VSSLRICSLYPELMNIYADRGNIAVLRARCEWRGIGFEHGAASMRKAVDPDAWDVFYMGGGQDRDQAAVAVDMVETKRDALHAAAGRGAVVLAVCGGYQLLGHRYRGHQGDEIPGIGLVDLETVAGDRRMIGNILCTCDLDDGQGPRQLVGFENHAGRTLLGPGVAPLARVVAGHGNDGESGREGVRQGRIVGTYIHGPLLPKNPWLADWLIARALERRHGKVRLEPLDDAFERRAADSAARIARA